MMSDVEWLKLNEHLFESFDVGNNDDCYYDLTFDEALEKAEEMKAEYPHDEVWIRPVQYFYV